VEQLQHLLILFFYFPASTDYFFFSFLRKKTQVQFGVVSLCLPQWFCMFLLMSENGYVDYLLVSKGASHTSNHPHCQAPLCRVLWVLASGSVLSSLTMTAAALSFDNSM